MSAASLVKMANHIASNVPARHDPAAETAAHIQRFWSPAMIDSLAQQVADDPSSVSTPVQSALATLRPERVS